MLAECFVFAGILVYTLKTQSFFVLAWMKSCEAIQPNAKFCDRRLAGGSLFPCWPLDVWDLHTSGVPENVFISAPNHVPVAEEDKYEANTSVKSYLSD